MLRACRDTEGVAAAPANPAAVGVRYDGDRDERALCVRVLCAAARCICQRGCGYESACPSGSALNAYVCKNIQLTNWLHSKSVHPGP